MRTIKNPNEPVDCPKCRAKLEIERSDIQEDDIGVHPLFYVICPHCKTAIDVFDAAKKMGMT